jgi:hypothetical protein
MNQARAEVRQVQVASRRWAHLALREETGLFVYGVGWLGRHTGAIPKPVVPNEGVGAR